MRILFSTGSPAGYMAPPRLGDEQINCGPDWENRKENGRVVSLRTPVGSYDLAALASRLPPEQKPDAVVCLVDASRRNTPRNLRAFKCPRVLLVADTHHLRSPLTGMLNYIAAETFDRIVLLYDRHHAGIFRAAGVKNLFWFPGLTFPHGDAVVRAARASQRKACVAFVGQAGRVHPRRGKLLTRLQEAGLPLRHETVGQGEALRVYGSSLAGFNASLNGDLNLRFFEILASGAALLTDELAAGSGLDRLMENGVMTGIYRSAGELVERVRQALAHPEETSKTGAAGARWFDTRLGEQIRREAFCSLVMDNRGPEWCGPIRTDECVSSPGQGYPFSAAVAAYERVQELHRQLDDVVVALDEGAPEAFAQMCSTLPRVVLRQGLPGKEETRSDFYVTDRPGTVPENTPASFWNWRERSAEKGETGLRSAVKESRDLLLTHVEVNRRQGTGAFLQRLFPRAAAFVTVRSQSLYGGETEFGGDHYATDRAGAGNEARRLVLRRILAGYRICRILAVPFFESDFIHALTAREITGAPLCTFVMDDQALYGRPAMRELAARTLAVSRLRLVISPEMKAAYEAHFGLPFAVMPPVMTSVETRRENSWRPERIPARYLVAGNIWTPGQLRQLRGLARAGGLLLDWVGGGMDFGWMAPAADLERDGIRRLGFLSEAELIARLAEAPLVIIPGGMLDGNEDSEWLTRLSLPSRMVFILTQTCTPMLVLGSPETCAARFVLGLGIGLCCSYESADVVQTVRRMMDPETRARFVARARAVAGAFVMPDAGEWIWRSLEAGCPQAAPFDAIWPGSLTNPATPAHTSPLPA
ncbi:hypothetical protein OpiT1DRAFT_04853 [Opitutaceae bacterium TAV1]|nr:hypothetical protein OpiT1DRAFT_04853 [Opitutaceae bacterium TAV1]